MATRALRTAASGLYAQQLNIEVISNNIANVNTTGFKKNKAEFQDLMYQEVAVNPLSSTSQGANDTTSSKIQVGNGVAPSSSQKVFTQGDITATNNQFDMAIQGDGFFQVKKADGTYSYTRDGSFQVNAALLSTGHPFSISLNLTTMGGTFRLLTPNITNNDTSGIWFVDIDSTNSYVPSLNISGQTDTSGWRYVILVTQNSQTFSLGSFIDPLGACDDSTYSGTLPIRFPGQNLVQNAPAGLTFPISLAGAEVSIYVKPTKGSFKDLPGLKLLNATVPSVIQQKLLVSLNKADQKALPAGLMQVVIK